jgi:hypothetical protein
MDIILHEPLIDRCGRLPVDQELSLPEESHDMLETLGCFGEVTRSIPLKPADIVLDGC